MTVSALELTQRSEEVHRTTALSPSSVSQTSLPALPALPAWIGDVRRSAGESLAVPEWEELPLSSVNANSSSPTASAINNDTIADADADADLTKPQSAGYRIDNGWKGRDLMHDVYSPVRIIDYYIKYGAGNGWDDGTSFARGGVDTRLTGIVHFTRRAESHRGYCHGGAMCSLLDDAIGWVAFCVTGSCRPWSGFTVQVNTSLCKPIPVDSVLLVQATISKVERRKVYVEAQIYHPVDNAVYAKGDGLVILNRNVLPMLSRESTSSFMSEDFSA
jgi:acyl-coenzyme A thioesterase PaaI-like protein